MPGPLLDQEINAGILAVVDDKDVIQQAKAEVSERSALRPM